MGEKEGRKDIYQGGEEEELSKIRRKAKARISEDILNNKGLYNQQAI